MSYEVLARKYRPQTFDEVVGQHLVTETLKNAISQGRVAHGYVFSGARGVGKTTTARILAKALNCAQGPTLIPCGECDSCREIASATAVDVLEIDAASNRGIDEIRELRENVRYLPSRDRRKIFIIDEVHMLTPEAFNALLKTLEEPPENVLFILATTEPHKIPTTILSRCQHFAFRLVDYAEILDQVRTVAEKEKIRCDEASLSLIAQSAAGSLRDAFSLLDQAIAYCGEEIQEGPLRRLLGAVPAELLEELLRAVRAADASSVFQLVERLLTQGFELQHLSSEFMRFIRNLLVARTCGADAKLLPFPEQTRKRLTELAGAFNQEDLTRFLQILLRVQSEVRYAPEPRFHLELALMKLVHAQRLEPLENLLSELSAGATSPRTSDGTSDKTSSLAPEKSSGRARSAEASPQAAKAASSSEPPASKQEPAAEETLSSGPGASLEASPANGEQEKLTAIKSRVRQRSKFLSNFLDHNLVGWRCGDGQAHFVFSEEVRWALDLLEGRENREALREACREVFARPVRVEISIVDGDGDGEGYGAASGKAGAPLPAAERAQRDPQIRAVLERFDGDWLGAKDLSRE